MIPVAQKRVMPVLIFEQLLKKQRVKLPLQLRNVLPFYNNLTAENIHRFCEIKMRQQD